MSHRLKLILLSAAILLHPIANPGASECSLICQEQQKSEGLRLLEKTVQRTYSVHKLFRRVYSAGWEGANGAIGAAHLYAVTHDTTLVTAYRTNMNLLQMYNGTWVDDRAWICLAEMYWWHFTGRNATVWVQDARKRYLDARAEGRLSNHEGVWSWYNWPKNWKIDDKVFTNSNMNQMVSVACWLYEATKEKQFYNDAMRVWNGDSKYPGIEKTLYRGNGRWEGKPGLAAWGKQIPWEGAEYCSIGASMYRMTLDPKYKKIVVATAKRIMDPATGWVDSQDFYQLKMDGNGAFVHYILDAYLIAPDELPEIPGKIQKMLEHVWTNHNDKAKVILHRLGDDGIRNGWNPNGGEDGYFVDQVGTVHAQSQALRAFGVFAYALRQKLAKNW
jgi:hypothetical protein